MARLWCEAWVAILACAGGGCGGDESPPASNPCGDETSTVVNIVDGDTVDLENGIRIRYLLIDTPEITSNDCYAWEAKDLNSSLVLNQPVGLEYDVECQDRYGRTLAYVSLGDRMVNRVLLERGYARLLVIAPNEKYADEFRTIEAEAKAAKAGLWGACP